MLRSLVRFQLAPPASPTTLRRYPLCVAPTADVREFSDTRFRRSKTIRFSLVIVLFAFLLGSMSSTAASGVVWLYIVIGALFIGFLGIGLVRSFGVAIVLTDEGVEVRTTYATKRWAWDSIERARALDKEVRTSPYVFGVAKMAHREERTKVYPILDLVNGRDVRLYGLQTVANDLEDSEWIDDAVLTINRTIAARRGEPDPSAARPR
jgi:Bacterial PH domain